MYPYMQNKNAHANLFLQVLEATINEVQNDTVRNATKFTKVYADARYNKFRIMNQWRNVLENIRSQYGEPTPVQKEEEMYRVRIG